METSHMPPLPMVAADALTPQHCPHGYTLKDPCPKCMTVLPKCDYGFCDEAPIVILACWAWGRIVERRSACAKHARYDHHGVGYRTDH
jgi:hypothetical protein